MDTLSTKEVFWHGSCYKAYTSKRNLTFISPIGQSYIESNPYCKESTSANLERVSRSQTEAVDWSLCLFCQKVKHKGSKVLTNVSSFDACDSIRAAAETRGDSAMIRNIQGVDLIAMEAKYHSACRASYVSKSNIKHQTFKEENEEEECVYAQALQELLEEISPGISGKAYEMSYLLERFKAKLSMSGIASWNTYRSEKLKRRLKNHFSDSIVFHKQPDPSKPELVYSSKISVQSIINATASLRKPRQEHPRSDSNETAREPETDKMKVLYHAAQILRSDVKNCKGIPIHPLSVDDVSLDKGKRLLPDSLYGFLC